jgi:hypothetical protein
LPVRVATGKRVLLSIRPLSALISTPPVTFSIASGPTCTVALLKTNRGIIFHKLLEVTGVECCYSVADSMTIIVRFLLVFLSVICTARSLSAQLPFYTDDTSVTERGKWHLEFFNEYDALQLQYPNLRQNTANLKINYGLPHSLELDLDAPYISLYRSAGNEPANGLGDTNTGIKWNFLKERKASRHPAFGVSFYVEFPTGNPGKQLGSGLTDYALNFMIQKSVSKKTRINGNGGLLFTGNTSTGVLGTQNARGQVYTGGLSLLHDFNDRITLGAEVYGAYAPSEALSKTQLQGMAGGQYSLRKRLALCFGLLGGVYVASPRIGGQLGVSVDFP